MPVDLVQELGTSKSELRYVACFLMIRSILKSIRTNSSAILMAGKRMLALRPVVVHESPELISQEIAGPHRGAYRRIDRAYTRKRANRSTVEFGLSHHCARTHEILVGQSVPVIGFEPTAEY